MAHPTQVAGTQYASVLTVSIHVSGCQCRQKTSKIGTRDAAIRSSRVVIRDKPTLSTAAIMIQHANSIGSYSTSRLAPTRLDRFLNHPHHPHVALMIARISMRSPSTAYGLSAFELASWISKCAAARQYVVRSHPSSLPGRPIQYSDTRDVYGFDTQKPHQVVPQDVIKFVQDIQDAIYAIPKGTPTSPRLASSSPYQSIKFSGFVVWYFHHISPRFPNPLLYFTSAGTAGMDPAVWDYIFDKYSRPAEALLRPLLSSSLPSHATANETRSPRGP